jgi:hypothetical protein
MPCQRRRSQALRDAIDYNNDQGDLRFVTLTQTHREEPLEESIKRIRVHFAALRRHRLWKSNVSGGASSLEIVLSRSGLWHVHLHCIVAGNFIDQGDLSEAWRSVTGDSKIVDIRIIKDLDRASHYVTKYITKPIDSYTLSQPAKLAEFARAIKGTRTYSLIGDWKKPPERPDADDPGDWEPVATVQEWHHACQLELPWALLLAEKMKDCRWLEKNPEPGG